MQAMLACLVAVEDTDAAVEVARRAKLGCPLRDALDARQDPLGFLAAAPAAPLASPTAVRLTL
jgi:hypothetical protein